METKKTVVGSSRTHELTRQVTSASLFYSNHGDRGRQGLFHHQGAVWAALLGVAHSANPGNSCSAHGLHSFTQTTHVPHIRTKCQRKQTQMHTAEQEAHTCALSSAPDRCPMTLNKSPPPTLPLSRSLLLLTCCWVSTKQKCTSSHDTSKLIFYGARQTDL